MASASSSTCFTVECRPQDIVVAFDPDCYFIPYIPLNEDGVTWRNYFYVGAADHDTIGDECIIDSNNREIIIRYDQCDIEKSVTEQSVLFSADIQYGNLQLAESNVLIGGQAGIKAPTPNVECEFTVYDITLSSEPDGQNQTDFDCRFNPLLFIYFDDGVVLAREHNQTRCDPLLSTQPDAMYACKDTDLLRTPCPEGIDKNATCKINICNCADGYEQAEDGVTCQLSSMPVCTGVHT